jgi:hypothetical protein
MMITGAFALSAAVGYFPAIDDTFCLSRMINFLPIYMIGYYLDMKEFNAFLTEKRWLKYIGWIGIIASLTVCRMGNWGMYSWRKWFTGRRSYEFLQDFFSYAYANGWWIRIAVWAFAIVLTIAIIEVIPDKDLGFITTIGARTLNVYFWHRPLCYMFRNWMVLPRLVTLFGGTYNEAMAGQLKGHAFGGSEWSMIAAYAVYLLIAVAMTVLFALKIFEHPCNDLMTLAAKVTGRNKK